MSLLVTSCTMGKQPSRLLDKGPSYLRTRTNTRIFAHRRRSAVELLEASKPQYVKSSNVLDHRQGFLYPDALHFTCRSNPVITKQPLRSSKSEYDVSRLQFDSDEDSKADTTDGGKLSCGSQQLDSNPLASFDGAFSKKINMSDRNSEKPSSSPMRRISTQELNCDKSANSLTLGTNHKHSHHSRSCHNLEGMSGDGTIKNASVNDSNMPISADEGVLEPSCVPVHRSHSDLNYHHTRNSSDISDNSARFSRASADLEKFFNQMGLEKNVLDPMLRLQEVHNQRDFELFESVSSLDSPDTRSICSGISKSEKGYSDVESAEKSQGHSSVVERNARIIKWLCNVKKSKAHLAGQK